VVSFIVIKGRTRTRTDDLAIPYVLVGKRYHRIPHMRICGAKMVLSVVEIEPQRES
jgi:hypothetical protein